MSEWAKRLRKARISKGMTQLELGALIGRSDEMISQWETGKSPIPQWMQLFIETHLESASDSLAVAAK